MEASEHEVPSTNKNEFKKKSYKTLGFCLMGVSGISAIVAGFITSHLAKKKGKKFLKLLEKSSEQMKESPTSLALRALAWSTFWSVGFCSLVVFGVCKWFSIKSLEDVRQIRLRSKGKKTESEEIIEYESLAALLKHLNEKSN